MTWHVEILGPRQERVLGQIGPSLSRRDFFLVGGTAVALQIGHRRSVDFDWFTRKRFDPHRMASELREDGIEFISEDIATGTLHGKVGGVQVSLIRHNYPLLAKLRTLEGEIAVAARADLAAMKLAAVAQRGAKKDFVDIYALGQADDSLERILPTYKSKYAISDVAHLLRSLAYFDDADKERMPKMLWNVKWRTVKDIIRGWLRDVD